MTTASPSSPRRGVSIMEMSVVLALVSVVSLLVASFTVMVNLRSTTGVIKNRVADDLRLSKILLENWTETVTETYGAQLTVAADGESLMATIDGVIYATQLTEDSLIATLPDGQQLHCPIGEISVLTFQGMNRMDGEQLQDAIWFCTAEYALPHSDGATIPQQSTFCINSHVGDSLS